jgi:two-component system, cell cycle response regulator DivK
MGFQKGQNRAQKRRIVEARAKIVGGKPGHRQQPAGAHSIAEQPPQCGERKGTIGLFICFSGVHRLHYIRVQKEEPVGQKILVVEDNELNLKLFCDLLRAHGYEAEPVRDGREAVARARDFAPDLVIMDIQLPHISGLELIDQLKADDELKAIPIMAVTAYAAKGDEERIREAGAEGYVSKPISVVRFVEAVANLLQPPLVGATHGPEAGARL